MYVKLTPVFRVLIRKQQLILSVCGHLVADARTYFTSLDRKKAIFFKQLFLEGEENFNYVYKVKIL